MTGRIKLPAYLGIVVVLVMATAMSPQIKNVMTMDNGIPVCTTLAQLKKHAGQRIEIQGVYRHPGNGRLDQQKLLLKDGKSIVIHTDDAKYEALSKINSGRSLSLIAKFYEKDIPVIYELESRTAEPVIVGIESVQLLKR